LADYPSTHQPPVTVGAQKVRLENHLLADKQRIGGTPVQGLTIASGVVTPASGVAAYLRVDTEGGAPTDDLTHIAVANLPEGTVAIVQAVADARVVVAKNAAGGSGQLLLAGGADLSLAGAQKSLFLVRIGTSWEEFHRGYGADATALRAFLGLGTAALVNTGITSVDVPTNAQIFDTARDYTRQHRFVEVALTDASTIAWNLDTQQIASVSLGANRTLGNFTNGKAGGGYRLRVVTNGFNISSYGSNYRWPSGTPPVLSAGAWWIISGDCNGTLMALSVQGPFSL
jgi:hypothetical protein